MSMSSTEAADQHRDVRRSDTPQIPSIALVQAGQLSCDPSIKFTCYKLFYYSAHQYSQKWQQPPFIDELEKKQNR